MKRLPILEIIIFLLISDIISISTTMLYKNKINREVFKVYSFEGENNGIKISDGIIVIYPNKQVLNGGEMQYLGNGQQSIKSYSKNIYIDKQGHEEKILANSVSFTESTKQTTLSDELLLNKDIGEVSSEKLFSEEDISSIKDKLYFSFNYSTSDGKAESIVIKLKVKEFDMKEDK